MRHRLLALVRSAGARHGMIMAAAIAVAGGFDYLANVVVGRLLSPAQFGVFVAVTALLQVMVYLTNVIRNVVAYYTAELAVQGDHLTGIGAFLQRRWRWAWRWGLLAMLLMALLSPLIARFLRMESPQAILAGSALLPLLFLRPVTDGALQGLQRFFGLGTVQVLQSGLRLLLAALLIGVGWQAAGAIFSLPLASAAALLLALWLLRPYFRTSQGDEPVKQVSARYSTYTLIGLLAYALLINIDALVVKRVFSPEIAGNYGTAVTMGKINLFIAIGIGLVLFPKVVQRQSSGRPGTPVLLAALIVTLLPGLFLSLVYFLFPGQIVEQIFTSAYADPGILLGLVGLATTLYAGIYIWLNYALSLDRPGFVYALAGVVIAQALALAFIHDTLISVASVMVTGGIVGNLAGLATTLWQPAGN